MFDIKNITMIYDMEKTEKVYALGGFDLKLPDRGLIGIIGPSGSGKSTLMYCLSTLKTPTDGKIIYNGKELTKLKNSERENIRRNEFGFVFQRHFLVPYMSAVDNVTVAAASKTPEVEEKAKKISDTANRIFNSINEKTPIITNYNVISSKTYHLPTLPSLLKRVMTKAIIEVDGRLVSVYNTHLDFQYEVVKQRQLKKILKRFFKSSYMIRIADATSSALFFCRFSSTLIPLSMCWSIGLHLVVQEG